MIALIELVTDLANDLSKINKQVDSSLKIIRNEIKMLEEMKEQNKNQLERINELMASRKTHETL